MIHPDYQYTPKLLPAMAGLVASDLYACVLGSRILGGQALRGGMPLWRYVPNRVLTLVGNMLLGTKLSEFHTGYRAYSRELLERLPLDANSILRVRPSGAAESVAGYHIGSFLPTRYAPDASSLTSGEVCITGRCLSTSIAFRLANWRFSSPRFPRRSSDFYLFFAFRSRCDGVLPAPPLLVSARRRRDLSAPE